MVMERFTNINWSDLLYSIKENEAIVLLGHNVLQNDGNQPLYNTLFRRLATEKSESILDFYENEGLFLFNQEMDKGTYVREIKKQFSRTEPPEVLSKLAQIPFHLYIKTTPDLLLRQVFEQHKIKHQFTHFSPILPHDKIEAISANNPLIYNILGSLKDDDESIILSHDDMFKYLQSILGQKGIPTEIRKAMQASNELIFIGFQFNKWYVQLLLRILELEKTKFAFNRIAAGSDQAGEVKQLCFNQFRIKIIDTNVNEFVDELYKQCANSKDITLRKMDNAEKIAQSIENASLQEQKIIEEKLTRLYKLLSDYELELDLTKDPSDRMRFELKITSIKEKIAEAKNELKKL